MIRKLLLVGVLFLSPAAMAADGGSQIVNPDFTRGADRPEGWTLSGGQGNWHDRQVLEVRGAGTDSNYWKADHTFEPGALYQFQVRMRRLGTGSGSAIVGPASANRDYANPGGDWTWHEYCFRVPDNAAKSYVRLGQWMANTPIQFDAVRLHAAVPVHRRIGHVVLGQGESIDKQTYRFLATYGGPGSNYHRPLVSATASFNSDRWCFGGDNQVTYRLAMPGCRFTNGRLEFHVNYHTRGACTAEVSRDGKQWHALAAQSAVGTAKAPLPDALLPADELFVRLRPATRSSSFQVNRVDFQARLDRPLPGGFGRADFAVLQPGSPELIVRRMTLHSDPNLEAPVLEIEAALRGDAAGSLELSVDAQARHRVLSSEAANTFRVALLDDRPGRHEVAFEIRGKATAKPVSLKGSFTFDVPDYYRTDYGQLLAEGVAGRPAVWCCAAAHKVARQRRAPADRAKAAMLSAARNDWEAVQVVVRPDKDLTGLTASVRALAGPAGAVIPAERVRVLRAYYHYVENPTDASGVRDWWPDALPPLDQPLDVAAGQNQPLWVLVYVPADARPGDYVGSLQLKAGAWSCDVPLRLHVWDFALPKRNHLQTAFGFSPGMAFQYHQVKSEPDKRRLLDLYFQSFAEHRISTYDPTPLDPIRVKFLPDSQPPRAELDFTAFDAAMSRAVERFHFTGFRLPIQGMGGGTFHERFEPKIGKYGEHTPQYQAAFASYAKQLEEHLRAKGWLDMAYVYWFDEPDPKDYAFVQSGMARLKRYAPGLQRMLTEEPAEGLFDAVDIWCPVTPNYDHAKAESRRKQGQRFWWYVCCGPKAPFCTLFIDHPATELRVWHWQTWQRGIVGTLVWETNYWTSSAAYPDQPQNPYEDPMGYVSGYSTAKGVKQFWGNGDGRFIYPPLSAAVPGKSGAQPVLAPPVSSIRWEMLREGVEDYEFLYLLRDLLAKHRAKLPPDEVRHLETLLTVPDAITKSMTTFTTDPEPVYRRRAEIAVAIERLLAIEKKN